MPKWQFRIYNIAMELKELRLRCGLTQPQAAKLVGIPFRTYCRYEAKGEGFKYDQMVRILGGLYRERVLSIDEIRDAIASLCVHFPVDACYLFGSYAKDKATKESDVDLMIVSSIEGIDYYELVGLLEEKLGKKVDLIRLEAATQNPKLLNEILIDGLKVYQR